ncbi:MAG TPA: NrfD/PsrC family molybdoenzyme membrane anchor subunit, partial [Thermoleophilaceae bacterium]|nr:NrfD/PsrC family molybdoenzyme membrane anchor subunit [Thermoleophilaceae bacterium]
WYVGLLPDLATLRDRARGRRRKLAYGFLALGWRGSAWQWHHHQIAYRLLAAAVVPLILFMQSVVAFEFAVTLVPDWHQTRYPVHFVVSALVSGLATVLLIALVLRRSLGIERFITDDDVAVMAKLLLASSLVLAYSYADEAFMALLGDRYARAAWLGRVTGEFAGIYWGALLAGVGLAQLLWFRRVRAGFWAPIAIAIGINAGVWLDRFSIVVAGLYRDYLPSAWGDYQPTYPKWLLLLGTAGLFCGLLLLFVRFLPVITMFETRHAEREEEE